MVLGLRTKPRKSPSFQTEYIIHILEIKPWPPSQSLRTLRAVVIQWEHGERSSGLTNQVVPSVGTGSGVGDGRIEFDESFRLPVTLVRETSIRGGDGETFQKNWVEFNLYEPRRDKIARGQLLGTAVVDLADYGVVKESLIISVPINCKRTYGNTAQPLIFLKIQPLDKDLTISSSRESLMREATMDRNHLMREATMDRDHSDSVSALMSEEYAEEAEFASLTTDDDVSSHSSLAVTSSVVESNATSSPQNNENGTVAVNGIAGEAKVDHVTHQLVSNSVEQQLTESWVNSSGNSSRSSSMDLSGDLAWISKKTNSQSLQSSAADETEQESRSDIRSNEHEKEAEDTLVIKVNSESVVKVQPSSNEGTFTSAIAKGTIEDNNHQTNKHLNSVEFLRHRHGGKNALSPRTEDLLEVKRTNSPQNGSADGKTGEKLKEYEEKVRRIVEDKGQQIEDKPMSDFSLVDVQKQGTLENNLHSTTKESFGFNNHFSNNDRSRHVKSVRSSIDLNISNGYVQGNQFYVADTQNNARGSTSSERKEPKLYANDTRRLLSDSRIQNLEHRIKILEGELREIAAIEVGLYSVVAEHGSSTNKVHAPARRLSRLYFHANKLNSKSRRGSAAKSVVSGLVLVAKACGNDVPRLTFWLSNSIVLRAIINKYFEESQVPISVGPAIGRVRDKNENKKTSPLKWESFPSKNTRNSIQGDFGDWENPQTFAAVLEKVEAWIFSRIIESVWWQIFTPHMQSGAAKAFRGSMDSESIKLFQRASSSSDQQGNFSLELWIKAFRDACERICPVRSAGHDCGCLSVLSRLIMEQLIARLDVAMFNAILRESADEIPTDPVADPISDAEVLPIPAGKSSFGAGAQLKNAIGNWSRCLTDLFGIDDGDDSHENDGDDELKSHYMPLKSFHLLNALSDLMMLPKDMLLSQTIRKEVCPTFGPPLIRRVLNSFIPDEFCPDPVPGVVVEALNSEDPFEGEEDSFAVNYPCSAASIIYLPPTAASAAVFLGEIDKQCQLTRSGSSVLKKSQTSDDELDELDSPLKSVILDSFQTLPSSVKPGWISNENGSQNALRYQLLRQIWMNTE